VTPGDEHGSPQLAIRGITTGGFTNPTVGVVIDDIPYGATLSTAYGMEAPDVDPSDLASVEVLRGPQGTLYGASSMGGLLKFMTLAPSTDKLGGRVQASLNGVRNGDEPAYGIRGSVNVPLSDTFAMRASGSTRRDAGYVDNARNGERAVNSVDAYGGRLSTLWRPSDDFDVKLSALVQRSKTDGSPSVKLQPGLADLQQDNVPGTGWRDLKIEAYGATLTARFGTAEITALSGYSINTVSDSYDLSYNYGGLADQFFGVGGAPLPEEVKTRKFTQEVRLATPLGTQFDWLIGAFYNDESSSVGETVLAADAMNGSVVGVVGHFDLGKSKYSEYAAFTDLTWKPTTQFDVQLGIREGHNRTTIAEQVYSGVMFGPDPFVIDAARAKGDSITYLITPRLKLSPDLMMYVRAASGYRPGGPSGALSPGLPTVYDPDKTQNVEFGIKGSLFDNTFSYDASVYYIAWKDIQIQLRDPALDGVYFTNGGRGKSQGVELALESRPLRNLRIAFAGSYNDAKLTEDFPAESSGIGASGDRLPNSSRFSGSLSIEQSLPVRGNITAFFGGTLSYVGDRLSTFASIFSPDVPRQRFPAYARTDLRAGLEYETWGFNLFLNNAWDRRGILAGGAGSLDPNAFYYIQPRTVGMSVTRSF
jgi:outer membrane receptor protein involved in Fe transport